MIFPDTFEQKTGFDRIRTLLHQKCLCALGIANVAKMHFLDDHAAIELFCSQTEEFRQILMSGETFPSQDYHDSTPELKRIRLEGTWIETEELLLFKLSYSTIGDVVEYLKKRDVQYPVLNKSMALPVFNKQIIQAASRIIDEKASIRDTASERLREIRAEVLSISNSIGRKTRKILQSLKKDGLVPDEAEITIRNGRAVIPVYSSSKRRVRGFIHDESASGLTSYIEPAEVFEMNNDLRDLEYEEKKEIIRILTEFTNLLRPELPGIIEAYQFLGQIDFIRAKALLALDMGAAKTKITGTPGMLWFDAVNPLLKLSHARQQKEVVPLSFEMKEDQRILVISGPNAGGKSVCLKTAGLLQYMLQNGMLVPMKDYSETGIFKQIFIEIGDEQSIENDLSTYSSHLRNLKYFCDHTNTSTLFLIDEFGSGTEPHLGGAIAEAVLVHLSKQGAFGIVTTHYGNLKLLAGKIPGVVNGAMLFDTKRMKPVYKLSVGNPGSSYAFEIAGQIGFSNEILDEAARLTGGTQLDFDRQLKELESEKEELQKRQIQIDVADSFLAETIAKYQDLLGKLDSSKREIIGKAKSDAAALLAEANRTIENTIRGIREAQADKEKTKQLRQDLNVLIESKPAIEKQKTDVQNVPETKRKKKVLKYDNVGEKKLPAAEMRPAAKGDYVSMTGQEGIGIIEEIKNGRGLVIINDMKVWWPLDELKLVSKREYEGSLRKRIKNVPASFYNGLEEKSASFKIMIDVRGKRAEEVQSLITSWLDDAVLLRIHELRILHGKGNGVLRSVIRELLSRTREVRSFRDEILEQGGHGITVVELE